MKILIWGSFIVLTLLWTVGIALTAMIVEWLIAASQSGQASGWVKQIGSWSVPTWLGFWFDTTWLRSMQAFVADGLQCLISVLPSSVNLAGWVTTLIWIIWAVAALLMLLSALLAHWLVTKKRR